MSQQTLAQGAQVQLSQENIQIYNRMKQEYAQIFKIFIELEDEKREHSYKKSEIRQNISKTFFF